MRIDGKSFEHRPINELVAIVKNDLKKLDSEGLIDEGTLIKVVQNCNERLGIFIKEVKQTCMPVEQFKTKLPLDFDKVYFLCATKATASISERPVNLSDNSFDRDILYEAKLEKDNLGGVDAYKIIIKKEHNVEVISHGNWVEIGVDSGVDRCHPQSPNTKKPGRHSVSIIGDEIHTSFRSGDIYMMYIGNMKDEDGNILYPFHPLITPWYEWCLKEKVIMDAIFNSDSTPELGQLLQVAQREKAKAWLDAYDFTTTQSYNEYLHDRRKRELKWFQQYFRLFQNNPI